MRIGEWIRRRWLIVGLICGLVGITSAAFWWRNRDLWPPRLVIALPRDSRPLGFSTHERSFQTSDLKAITVWDLATGRPIEPAPTSWHWLQSLSRDGRTFVAMVADATGNQQTVVLGDTATEAIRRRFPLPPQRAARGVRLIDDDRRVRAFTLRGDAMEVITWDVASGTETTRPIAGPGPGFKVPSSFSPDGRVWAYWDLARYGVQLWDAESDQALGSLLRTPTTPPPVGWTWVATAFTPDGRTLLVGRSDGQVEFWDVPRLRWIKTVRLYPSDHFVFDLQVAADGRTLISTGVVPPPLVRPTGVLATLAMVRSWIWGASRWDEDSELVITDLATDQPLARSPQTIIGGVSRDGRTIVTAEQRKTLSIRDVPQPAGR